MKNFNVVTSSHLGFLIIWALKLNIASSYLSNENMIYISDRSLKGKFTLFFFEQEELNKNGATFSTNHWLVFETSISSLSINQTSGQCFSRALIGYSNSG